MEVFARSVASVVSGAALGIACESVASAGIFSNITNGFVSNQTAASRVDSFLSMALEIGLLAAGVGFVNRGFNYFGDDDAAFLLFGMAISHTTPKLASKLVSIGNLFNGMAASTVKATGITEDGEN